MQEAEICLDFYNMTISSKDVGGCVKVRVREQPFHPRHCAQTTITCPSILPPLTPYPLQVQIKVFDITVLDENIGCFNIPLFLLDSGTQRPSNSVRQLAQVGSVGQL